MGGRERAKKGGALLLERSCTPEGLGNNERWRGGLKRINIMSPHNCICTSVEAVQNCVGQMRSFVQGRTGLSVTHTMKLKMFTLEKQKKELKGLKQL